MLLGPSRAVRWTLFYGHESGRSRVGSLSVLGFVIEIGLWMAGWDREWYVMVLRAFECSRAVTAAVLVQQVME